MAMLSRAGAAFFTQFVCATVIFASGCTLPHSISSRSDVVTPVDVVDVVGVEVGVDVVTMDAPDADTVERDVPPPPDSAGCNANEMRCAGVCVPVDVTTRCGRCDNDCTMLFGVVQSAVSCVAGACSLTGACQPRYADCNRSPDDGCETDISLPANCGACGAACTASAPMCSASGSAYACATGCSGATSTLCGASCVDVTSDPAHCGSCTGACAIPANGRATCSAGMCDFVCDSGYHRCGDHCASDTSLTECGSTCLACTTSSGVTASCTGGSCTVASCPSGTADCNGVFADGCEVNLDTPAHCGACGTVCTVANGTPACNSGACAVGSCASGYADCNALYGDGCEQRLDSPNACGSCSNACGTPANGVATCTGGVCGIRCNMGFMLQGGVCLTPPPTCPNHSLDPGETCDDGNTTNGDGCDATCHLEQATPADNCPGTPIIARHGTQWYSGTTVGATSGFNCGGADVGPDRVYDLTIAEGGMVTIELIPDPGFDVVFNSRSGTCPGTADTFCVDAAGAGGTEYVLGASAATGSHYTIVIDGYTVSAGGYRWRITIM